MTKLTEEDLEKREKQYDQAVMKSDRAEKNGHKSGQKGAQKKKPVATNSEDEEEKDETLPISQNGLKSDFLEIYDELGINVTEDEAERADWVMTSRDKEGTEFVLKARSVDMTLVPNVKGMGLRDALYLLENSGLKVGVSGVGTVSQQSLTPGGKVRRGSYVHIELR